MTEREETAPVPLDLDALEEFVREEKEKEKQEAERKAAEGKEKEEAEQRSKQQDLERTVKAIVRRELARWGLYSAATVLVAVVGVVVYFKRLGL
jgi:preprotein translocase subunit SecF